MSGSIFYFAASSFSLCIFYLLYAFFLKKETFFSFNRAFLYFAIVFSLTVPLLHFNFGIKTYDMSGLLLPTAEITQGHTSPDNVEYSISLNEIIRIIYLIGFAVLLIKLLIDLTKLAFLIIKNRRFTGEIAGVIKLKSNNHSPFSFINKIFIPSNINENDEIMQIYLHEKVHIRQLHSVDIFISELLSIVFWFNPLVRLYKSAFRELHEYIADSEVIRNGFSTENYRALLARQAIGSINFRFA
ncbi:MAG: hypothetical protein QG635_710, partial [Bacteroidota bacterium]|nr:hypothetical protein [Bacteroidota bacterium]